MARNLPTARGLLEPLESIRVGTSQAKTDKPAADLAGFVGEIQLVRFAEPPASLEIDPSQDEARLVVGDQLYGTIRQADPDKVLLEVDEKPVRLDWKEIAGLHFRRIPAPGTPVQGVLARIEWRVAPGEAAQTRLPDFAEGAVTAVSATEITLMTPYAGTLTIPKDRILTLRVLDEGRQLVIDPASHHLGDNISTAPPLLDPPLPEGGSLERAFDLDAEPTGPGFLVFDVVQVVGETAGLPFSNLILKGELRTYVALNGKRIDYLNRHIATANETPERIKIAIPPGLLKRGKNLIRIEQTGIANDPNWLDDLGILQIAVLFTKPADPAKDRPPGAISKP